MSLALAERKKEDREQQVPAIIAALGPKSVVLIGLMGAGKTAVGKRLAAKLELPFVDADKEIEEAAGQSITEIFAEHGEAYFRQGERKVIARLLEAGPQVLATGGGAYMTEETRATIRQRGISIWLRAELERRGIASSQITETLANMDVDWVEAAETVRRKRFGAKVPADFKEQARQARFLQYRGFTAEQARAVLRKVPEA